MNNKHKILLIMLSTISVNSSSSCSTLSTPPSCTISTINSSIPVEKLLSSPDSLEINGNKFELQASLYRDLTINVYTDSSPQPSPYSDNENYRCLDASISVINKSTNIKLPKVYKFKRLWVINEKEVWETTTNSSVQDVMEFKGGPTWSIHPDKFYSVVIQFTDDQGKDFFIKSDKLNISIVG